MNNNKFHIFFNKNLSELKKYAKDNSIKGCSKLHKLEIITLIAKKLNFYDDLFIKIIKYYNMNTSELKEIVKKNSIKNHSKLNKLNLIYLIVENENNNISNKIIDMELIPNFNKMKINELKQYSQEKLGLNDVDKLKKKEIIELIQNNEINNSLSPLIKWSGGKKDEIKKFIQHIPTDFNTYLEPFVGGGAVFFHINPKKAVINDVHKELIDFYQSIKNGHNKDIYKFMKEHPNEEDIYYKVRAYKPKNELENANKFYYLRKTCFRGMLRYNSSGEFNIPFGRYKNCNFEDLLNIKYEKLLKNTTIFNKDFEYIFEKYNNENNFMFLDPPYDSQFTDYGYCSFGKNEHIKLAQCFKDTKIKCLMIIGKTDFIEDLYKDYIVDEYEKNYRFKLHSKRVGDEINTTHLIIKNY